MDNTKIIIGLFIFLLIIGITSAIEQNTFNDATTIGNLTFTAGNQSPTKTINLPAYITVTSARLFIRGYYYNYSDTLADMGTGGYNGEWSCGGTLYSAANANNANYNDYAACENDPALNSSWYGNFSILQGTRNVTYIYKAHRTATPSGIIIVQCKNISTNEWISIDYTASEETGIRSVNVSSRCYTAATDKVQMRINYANPGGSGTEYIGVWDSELVSLSYPHNVTLFMNNQSTIYNYGSGNNSAFDGLRIINLTSFFNTSSITLWNISFFSNTTGILEYSNLSVNYSYNFTVNFLDERDGSVFKLNQTNDTSLSIKCPDSYYTYSHITSGSYLASANCANPDYIKVDVIMNDQPSYYRTLFVNLSTQHSTDVYLVNLLENKSVVQIIYNLVDLNGRWAGSNVYLRHYVNSTNASIVEQEFDFDNKVYLWLMKDTEYFLTVVNPFGEVFNTNFIADQAEVKTLTLPDMGIYEDDYLEDNIRYYYSFNSTNRYAIFQYFDSGEYLPTLTTKVNFSFRWASNDSTIYYENYAANYVSSHDFIYYNLYVANASQYIKGNTSYIMEFWAEHQVLGTIHGKVIVGDFSQNLSHGGITDTNFENIFKYGGLIILIVILLSFGSKYSHIGGIITFIVAMVFKQLGLFGWITSGALMLIGIIAVINWMRREEVNIG